MKRQGQASNSSGLGRIAPCRIQIRQGATIVQSQEDDGAECQSWSNRALSIRSKRQAPLVLETRITTVKCSTAWNVAFQLESYLQLRWAIRCLALRLLNGSSPKTAGLFCMVPFIKAGLTLVLRPT